MNPSWVFTSTWPERTATPEYDLNDTDRHVSLAVDYMEEEDGRGRPVLYTKNWVSGLFFFEGYSPKEVLFPWPAPLQGIIPPARGSDSGRSL